jgi:4-hydroxy-tetrahydrodipicolinate reductase
MKANSTLKAWLSGFSGKMGQAILQENAPNFRFVGGTDVKGHHLFQEGKTTPSIPAEIDVIIDFSNAQANQALCAHLTKSGSKSAVLVATTGLSKDQIASWRDLAKSRPVLLAPNTSLGVLVTLQASKQLAKTLAPLGFDIEISEIHHREKLDAPSGTAKMLAEGVAEATGKTLVTNRSGKRQAHEIGMTALRGGGVFGEHTVHFFGDQETISLTHIALSRGLFAKGSLVLAGWLVKQKAGFYGLTDVHL